MYCCRPVPVSTTGSHQTRASVEDTGLAYTSVGGSVGTGEDREKEKEKDEKTFNVTSFICPRRFKNSKYKQKTKCVPSRG